MNNESSLFENIKNLIGSLAVVGGGILALAKWLDSRRTQQQVDTAAREKEVRAEKVAREDWLIENAFDIVKGLREELDRLRLINIRQAEELELAYVRMRFLETLLRASGIEVPDAQPNG